MKKTLAILLTAAMLTACADQHVLVYQPFVKVAEGKWKKAGPAQEVSFIVGDTIKVLYHKKGGKP